MAGKRITFFLMALFLISLGMVLACGDDDDDDDCCECDEQVEDDDSADDDDVLDDDDDVADDDDDVVDDDDDNEPPDSEVIPQGLCRADGAFRDGEISIEIVHGGYPGQDGSATAIGEGDRIFIAYAHQRKLYLSYGTEDAIAASEPVCLTWFGQQPDLALDSKGFRHIAYYDTRNTSLVYLTDKSGSWEKTEIGDRNDVGNYPSIVIDQNDNVHIAYFEMGNANLKYAHNVNDSWTVQLVLAIGQVGLYPEMAIDSQGFIHIVYTDIFEDYLGNIPYYVTNQSGYWIPRPIGVFGASVSALVLDENDVPHAFVTAHSYSGSGYLVHATNEVGYWTSEILETQGYVGYPYAFREANGTIHLLESKHYLKFENGVWTDEQIPGSAGKIAVSDAGKVVTASVAGTGGNFEMVTNLTGVWGATKLSERIVTYRTSIAADSSNNMHLSCSRRVGDGDEQLAYASKSNGSWQVEVLAEQPSARFYSSIAIDDWDTVHIVYENTASDALSYMQRIYGGTWNEQGVDSDAASPSIALDSNGKVHIAYHSEVGDGSLKYAYQGAGGWEIEIIDDNPAPFSGNLPSIVLDASDNVHVSHVDDENGHLRYTTNESGDWISTVVDDRGWVEGRSSIVVDADGFLHIAYYKSAYDGLEVHHTTNATGMWESSYVDSVAYLYTYTGIGIRIDTDGHAQIVYYDRISDGVKFAANYSGYWRAYEIDNAGFVGSDTNIALDENGVVHTIYSAHGLSHAWFPVDLGNSP